METVAIIGAGGFVGTRLVESLVLDGGPKVCAVVRAFRNFASLSRFGSAISVKVADAESADSLASALRGASVVVNLTTGTPASIIRTTRAIYEACETAKVGRLIHMSSAVVYGEVVSPQITDDSPPVSGHWMPYARAKAAAEIWLRQQIPSAPFQTAVLRPGIVWGVRSPHTVDIVKSLLNKTAYLVDGGKGVFNSIYIDNLVACIKTCSAHPGNITGFYNVADEEELTWRDFFQAFAAPLGYDLRRIPNVSGSRFPWSPSALIDCVSSLPFVSDFYFHLKSRLPDAVKMRIKGLLAGHYNYEWAAPRYLTRPKVERELWGLQRVRNKLSARKFARKFNFSPSVTFQEGVRRTLHWLDFVGYLPPRGGPAFNGVSHETCKAH